MRAAAGSRSAAKVAVDPVTEEWYAPATAELAAMNRQAEGLLHDGKSDQAAAVITKGQALAARLLAAPRPTLGAMEAASDLDQLYAGDAAGESELRMGAAGVSEEPESLEELAAADGGDGAAPEISARRNRGVRPADRAVSPQYQPGTKDCPASPS